MRRGGRKEECVKEEVAAWTNNLLNEGSIVDPEWADNAVEKYR